MHTYIDMDTDTRYCNTIIFENLGHETKGMR